jgi:hypothetical protein
MVRCPDCQKEVDVDFGMTTCSSCGAVFMVEIDGSVQESLPTEEDEPVSEAPDAIVEDEAPPAESAFFDSEEPRSLAQETQLMENASPEYSEDFLDQLSETPKSNVAESALNDQNDPLDIQRFDQVTASELSDGEYLYDVTIVGIDSADLKKEVILALSDKRFDLPVENLRKQVHQGVLKIPNLNPVRAMLIVLKTQELDVVVDWKQKHFTQTTSAPKSEVEI